MLRPTDPPPTRARISGPVPGRDAPAPTRLVYVTPPRPVYECTTPDGERYTSASPEGNPRWMPVWAPGYAAGPYPVDRGSYGAGVEYRSGGTTIRIGGGRDWRYPMPVVPVYGPAGTWIRDTCSLLPPAEVCMRLRDRRDALDRRYNSALQSERDAITREQRGIDAQLAGECRA